LHYLCGENSQFLPVYRHLLLVVPVRTGESEQVSSEGRYLSSTKQTNEPNNELAEYSCDERESETTQKVCSKECCKECRMLTLIIANIYIHNIIIMYSIWTTCLFLYPLSRHSFDDKI